MKSYSPILADRLAISAAAGIPRIIDEIKIAVAVAQRKDEIARDAASGKIRALVQTLTEKREAERLGNSEKGAQLVMSSTKHLFDEIERIIKTGVGDSTVVKFGFGRPMDQLLYVNTVGGMYLGLALRNFAMNCVNNTVLETRVFQREFGAFGGPERGGCDIDEATYKPSFRDDKVIWLTGDEDQRVFLTGDLAINLVEWYIDHVREETMH